MNIASQSVPDGTVGFIDDVLRHRLWPAKEFFYDLLRHPVVEATGREPLPSLRRAIWDDSQLAKSVAPRDKDPALFDDDRSWAHCFERMPPDAAALYADYVRPETTYFSYEMTPGMMRFLRERGAPFVDFRISPLRFLSDLVIAVRTNIPQLEAALETVAVHKAEIDETAGQMRAAFLHRHRYVRQIESFAGKTAYIGQTPLDASLVRKGDFADIADNREALAEIARRGPVVYMPHPSAPPEHRHYELEVLRSISPGCEISYANIYDLLCLDEDVRLAGLSSGALQEASYFGKEARAFLPPVCPLRFPGETDSRGYYQISFDTFTDADFIRHAVGRPQNALRREPLRRIRPSVLRDLHNVWWGYADHILKGRFFWDAVRQPVFDHMAHHMAFVLDSFADRGDAAVELRDRLDSHTWHWIDGNSTVLAVDGKIVRNGAPVGRYIVIDGARRIVALIWDGGIWADRMTIAADWSRMSGVNNLGHTIEIVRAEGAATAV